MKQARKTVVIGILGSTLDAGRGPERWSKWRPSVALCQHPDFLIHRFELLHPRKYEALAERVAADIASVSPETEVVLRLLENDKPWDLEETYGELHAFARAYPFRPDEEDYLVHITTGTHIAQICMFLLTESRHFPAKLLQAAPKAYRDGDLGTYAIIDLDLSRYDRIAQRFREEHHEGTSFLKSGIATRDAAFNRLIDRIEAVAIRSHDPILLCGPTGAGKSRLAERIYELKKSRHQVKGRLVTVNCATLRGDGAMSALFGHVKGSFTGALQDRLGLLRSADGGILFLDEIGELGADEQAMLLRALEQKAFLPMGSDKEVRSDFQLIAGTNRQLGAQVARGTFREDLLARIDLWSFRLPSLRERPDDLEPNLDYELEQFARRHGDRVTFNKEARAAFLAFATAPDTLWRGNFRDLNAAVTRMATLADGGRIGLGTVNEEVERLRENWKREEGGSHDRVSAALDPQKAAALDLFDRVQLEGVLRVCEESASLSDAGRRLFAASRAHRTSTNDADRLRKYLARFGLEKTNVGFR